jgi:hypothetical protein
MVTHLPRQSATQPLPTGRAEEAPQSVATRVLDWLRQGYCGLHGHDTMLHFEKERMFLQCVSCGHRTPGWELTEISHPPVTVRAEPARHAVLRPHLVSERRIA